MEEKNCPGCSNNCPEDNLSCGYGRKFFGQDEGHGEREHGRRGHGERGHGGREHGGHGFVESSDEVVNVLLKIGHTLHHSHGRDVRLDCLTADERARLIELLNKCLASL